MLEEVCSINHEELERFVTWLKKSFNALTLEKEENSVIIIPHEDTIRFKLSKALNVMKSSNILNYYSDTTKADHFEGNLAVFRVTAIDLGLFVKSVPESQAKNIEPCYEEKLNKLKYIQERLIECRGSINPGIEVRIDNVRDKNGNIINPSASTPYPHICLVYNDETLEDKYLSADNSINEWESNYENDEKKLPQHRNVGQGRGQLPPKLFSSLCELYQQARTDAQNEIDNIFYDFIGGHVERQCRIATPFCFRIKPESIEDGTLDKIIESWHTKKDETRGEDKKRKSNDTDFYWANRDREKKLKNLFTLGSPSK